MQVEELSDQQFKRFQHESLESLRAVVGSALADELAVVFGTTDRKVVTDTIHEVFTSLFGKIKGEVLIDELMTKSL